MKSAKRIQEEADYSEAGENSQLDQTAQFAILAGGEIGDKNGKKRKNSKDFKKYPFFGFKASDQEKKPTDEQGNQYLGLDTQIAFDSVCEVKEPKNCLKSSRRRKSYLELNNTNDTKSTLRKTRSVIMIKSLHLKLKSKKTEEGRGS